MTVHRLLYVIDTLEVGGAERSLLEIAQRLPRERFELVACSLYRGSALRDEFERSGVRVHSLELAGKYQFATAFRKLLNVVAAEKPHLVHTALFRADQVGRAVGRWTGVPVISSFVNLSYDPSRIKGNRYVDPRKLTVLRIVDSLTARWVTHFHSVSDVVRDSNCRYLHIAKNRVTVIPRGREVNGRKPITHDGDRQLKTSLGIETAYPVILNVGRLVDQKGQRTLVDAMRHVVAEYPTARLLIAGEGPLRKELQVRIAELELEDHVRLLGRREDVTRLLDVADCFAFPSIYEGLPGALIEAMLARCPVVASDIPVLRQAVEHAKTGWLVTAKNSLALAQGILTLARDDTLARCLGDAAHKSAADRFDIQQVALRMERMYERVIQSCTSLPKRSVSRISS